MNCEHAQTMILLNDSGELEQSKQTALQQHLAECEACRAFQKDLTTIMQNSSNPARDLDVSEFTMKRIEQEGLQHLNKHSRKHPAIRLAMIYSVAALLLLILSMRLLQPDSTPVPTDTVAAGTSDNLEWNDNWDQEFAELEVSFVLADLEINENTSTLYDDDTYDTETLAAELLAMEES